MGSCKVIDDEQLKMLSSLLTVAKELSIESGRCKLSVLIIMYFAFAVILVCADLASDLL